MSFNVIYNKDYPNSGQAASKWKNAELNSLELGQLIARNGVGAPGQVLAVGPSGALQWKTLSPSNITAGAPYQLLETDSMGEIVWTSDIRVLGCNIDGPFTLNGVVGLEGQIIKVDSFGEAIWGYFDLGQVVPGADNSIAQTIGTTVQFAKSINPDNVNVKIKLLFQSDPGTDGQIIKNVSGFPKWITPIVPVTQGSPRQLIQTNAAGTSAEWTSDISVNTINTNSGIGLSGNYGMSGEFIKNVGGSPIWTNIEAFDIFPGAANTVLVTTDTLTTEFTGSPVISDLILLDQLVLSNGQGTDGQVVQKQGGLPRWVNSLSPIGLGTAFQMLEMDNTGTFAQWVSTITPPAVATSRLILSSTQGSNGQLATSTGVATIYKDLDITQLPHGSNYQILQTNSQSNGVEWTNNIRPTSVQFTVIDPYSAQLNRYSSATIEARVYFVMNNSSNLFSTGVVFDIEFVVIGTNVTLTIPNFSVNTTPSGVFGSGNLVIRTSVVLPSNFYPKYNMEYPVPVTNLGALQNNPGKIQCKSAGNSTYTIYSNLSNGLFAGFPAGMNGSSFSFKGM